MLKFLTLDKTTYDNYIPPDIDGCIVEGELLDKLNQFYPFYNLTFIDGALTDIADDAEARLAHEAYLESLPDPKAEIIAEIESATTIASLRTAFLKYINAT